MISTDTLRRLWTDRHPWALEVQNLAARPIGAYGDLGQWHHLLYVMTGDGAHARESIARGLRGLTPEPTWGRNETRETTIEWAWRYDQLKSQMTPEERQTWRDRLFRRADLILDRDPAKPWGTQLADSDETVGHYFGLAAIAKYTAGEHARAPTLLQEGIAPQMRAVIRQYCAKAADGEWIESAEYNLGTVQLLLMGVATAGVEDYPEVLAFAHEAAEQIRWQMTPDYKDAIEWGDDQKPNDPSIHHRVATCAIIAGVTGDPDGKVRAEIQRMTAGKEPKDYWIDLYRALWFYDPVGESNYPQAYGLRIARGAGLVIWRQPTELHYVHFPIHLGVHHQVPHCGDYYVYRNGEWECDHPEGYSQAATAANAPNFSNIWWFAGLQPYDRGLVSAELLPGGGYRVVGRAAGTFLPPEYSDPPIPFLTEWVRVFEYDGKSTITVRDKFDGLDPAAPGMKLERYGGWYPTVPAQVAARVGLWSSLIHCPVLPTETATGYTWKTRGGETVSVSLSGHEKVSVKPAKEVVTFGYFNPGQLDGYVIQPASDQKQAEIVARTTFGSAVPPPLPPPPPPPPPAPPVFTEAARWEGEEKGGYRLDKVLMRRA